MTNEKMGQRGHGIKIAHWNKGPSFLQNKHLDIADHDLSLVQHQDYNFHTCSTLENQDIKMSRVVVYTHISLVVKRRSDLENNNISSIWLECGLPRQKKNLDLPCI